jgi:magnesium-transporting ATPase (P-type)
MPGSTCTWHITVAQEGPCTRNVNLECVANEDRLDFESTRDEMVRSRLLMLDIDQIIAEEATMPRDAHWHAQSILELTAQFATDVRWGLTLQEAAARLKQWGHNELRKDQAISPLAILAGQFRSLVIWVLIGAALVSVALGEVVDGMAILAIVLLNAIIGFFQEYRAERAVAALARLTAPRARVVRDGHAAVVPAADIVPGDLLLLPVTWSPPTPAWSKPRLCGPMRRH